MTSQYLHVEKYIENTFKLTSEYNTECESVGVDIERVRLAIFQGGKRLCLVRFYVTCLGQMAFILSHYSCLFLTIYEINWCSSTHGLSWLTGRDVTLVNSSLQTGTIIAPLQSYNSNIINIYTRKAHYINNNLNNPSRHTILVTWSITTI